MVIEELYVLYKSEINGELRMQMDIVIIKEEKRVRFKAFSVNKQIVEKSKDITLTADEQKRIVASGRWKDVV
ncbi:TPA: hypothetical protein ACTZ5A_000057 [Bacillus cereus]